MAVCNHLCVLIEYMRPTIEFGILLLFVRSLPLRDCSIAITRCTNTTSTKQILDEKPFDILIEKLRVRDFEFDIDRCAALNHRSSRN